MTLFANSPALQRSRKRFAWASRNFGRPCRFLLAPPFRRSFTLLSVRACFDVHRVTWRGVQVLLDPEIPLRGADLRMPVGERELLDLAGSPPTHCEQEASRREIDSFRLVKGRLFGPRFDHWEQGRISRGSEERQ